MDRLFSQTAGRSPTLSLATPGLTPVDESLVKSLLHVFAGRTRVGWRHVSGADADVVLCIPGSPFAEQARHCESETGRPVCLVLGDVDARSADWSRTLHRPIRMREFLDALEAIAAEIEADAKGSGRSRAPAASDARPPAQTRSLVEILRELHHQDDTDARILRINVDAHQLLVHLPRGRCYSVDGFDDGALADLSSPYHQVSVEPASSTPLGEAGASEQWIALEALLWRMGLLGRGQSALGKNPAHARYRLTCWPDLGKIPSNITHVRLTALFSKRAMAIDEAADMLGVSPDAVRDFLRACGCCGILEVTQPMPVATTRERESRRHHGGGGLFDRLRAALGMGH
ncbi:MAG TPA: hypothetical protein VFJ15_14535 [Oleiagrimonas sp.]|nr:hypothetical protein [Oleiagrimonas sp.]